MTPKLTDEMRDALQQQPGHPVEVQDDDTRKVYVLVAKEDFPQMIDAELRRQLQIGFDQVDAGDVAEWDVDEILTEAHRRHADQSS